MAHTAEDALRELLEVCLLQPAQHALVQVLQDEAVEKVRSGELPLKRVINQTLAAAFQSQSRATDAHLRTFVRALAALPSAPDAFAAVLAVRAKTAAKLLGSARLAAVRLASAVVDVALAALEATGDAPAWLKDVLAALSVLLEATLADAPRVQALAQKAVLTLAKAHAAALVPLLIETATGAGSDVQQFALWAVLAQLPSLAPDVEEKLWAKYAGWAFEARTRSRAVLRAADPRFQRLDNGRFDALIKPTLAKMLKKSPDAVLEAALALVAAAPLDFGCYVHEMFAPVLVAKLRSQKEDVRLLTVALARALLATFRDDAHVLAVVAEMGALLDGKHGILAQFYQREAIFAVLAAAADTAAAVIGAAGAKAIAATAVAALLKAIAKEAHDATRHVGLLALGKWLALAQELSADTRAAITAGLKHKSEHVVAGYLRTLVVFCRQASASQAALLQGFAADVLGVIKEANKKPNVVHLDGVLAVGVAGYLASASSEMDATMAHEGVADVLLSDKSFLEASVRALQSSLKAVGENGASPATPERPEISALAALPTALSWVLSSKQSTPSHAYKLLVELLASSVLPAQASAAAAVQGIFASSLEHCEGFVGAFQLKLAAVAAAEVDAKVARAALPPSSDVMTDASVVPAASVLRRALRVVVPERVHGDEAVREAVFARVFLASHHPFVVSGKTHSAFSREWNRIKLRFLAAAEPRAKNAATASDEAGDEKDDDEEEEEEAEETSDDRIDHLIEANDSLKQAIIDLLTRESDGALFSPLAAERLAAQRMLASLLEFAGNGEGESVALHDIIEDRLVKRVDSLGIGAISAFEVQVFRTPFDELYVAKKKGESSDEAPAASTRKRGTGRRGNEDEQWEQQVREELEKKKAKDKAKDKAAYSTEEKAQLAEQQRIRTQLQAKRELVDRVLETVEVLAVTRPDELHPAIPYLLRAFGVLFTNEVFASEASAALRSIAKAVSPAMLRHLHEDVANALRVVLQTELLAARSEKTRALAQMQHLFTRTLAGLMEYVFGFQFDSEADFDGDAPVNHIVPPTLHLIFPVLRALIQLEPGLRHWALPLFAVHARMIPDEEEEEIGDVVAQRLLRGDMIVLVLHLLSEKVTGGCAPIANPDLAPGLLLTKLCEGPSLSAAEWVPLLGDDGLLSEFPEVRHDVLKALLHVVEHDESELDVQANPLLTSRLFFACFDTDSTNQSIAKAVWEQTEAAISPLFAGQLLALLNHAHSNVRESASLALADGMKQFPETITPVVNNLKTQFLRSMPKPLETLDEFGIPKVKRPGQGEAKEEPGTYLPRCGVGLCLEKAVLSASFAKETVMDVVAFVIEHGLGDSNANVRTQMRKTGIQVVDTCGGGSNTAPLLQAFEHFLDQKPSAAQDHTIYDHQREGVVVCLGALAKHMDKTDPKVSSIVDSLLDALNIPAESVQRSVAACLTPLVPAVKARSTAILDDLLRRATSGETFGERIGAAFGVSAVVKGLGIAALKQHDLIPRLEEAMKSGGASARQGAMLVFECLSQRLGILFEPYIIVILPIMLKCFADASPQVRDAAGQTAKGIMANLSAHGVKLVLPSVLRALEDSAWRTKQAGIQMLGTMAYCAPRQLGSCLPMVVPKLTEALTDSHPKVRESSKGSLRDIGSVVRNPEIASISNALLNALEDPNKFTAEALQQLQSTSFVHSIDAPSLALVMPIITRGLKDRAGDAKKKAALIVGSMCSMINDAKDLLPYMDMVLPSLKSQLMDPIPEVRAVAAKAMGKLVKGLGEKHFADILAWLLEAMRGDFGSVERSGAAQGLCEVLVALGKERVEATLFDEIFPLARHPKFSVREGVLWIIAFLPPAFGKGFSVFLSEALPIVVSGLSDEAESVRDVAMHAGHVVVNAHAISHTRDILPSLEAGLFDDSWRIRQSSVALLGDLMYRISGTRAVGVSESADGAVDDDNDDDAAGSAAGDKAITKILGMERRNNILASLYMIRSDTSAVVRQSALQVWKSVVANTPKTLRQILEALMNAIVNALSGDNMEKQTMAGRTLGEIVRKLGEHVLPEIVPILRAGLSPTNSSGMRQGVCIGLAELIDCSTKKQLEDYVDTLVDAVLDGLCDELPEVRTSAAQAFDVLHKGIGYRAIDETVPSLLQRVRSTHAQTQERALLGLQEILRVKSREVLPYLIPRLLTTPVTAAAARAVSRVAQATGAVIHFQVERVFAVFVSQYVANEATNPAVADEIKRSLRDVVLSVENPGVHWLAIELCKYCESEVAPERVLAFTLVAEFAGHTKTQYADQVALFLRQIIGHLNDPETSVVQAASGALQGLNATVRPEELATHLDFIRQTINTLVSDARHRKGGVGTTGEYLLPGLCIPKGLEPFLPSYQHALMNGSPELRQSAATGLGELVLLSSAAALRPYLIKLTGPLIRIAGDRFPGHVKAAILNTLEVLLGKGGVALKPFLPQLQTTFVKALNDNAAEVRARGASALSKLVALSPRVDPLVAELTEKLRTTAGGIREANLAAVAAIMEVVGDKISAPVSAGLQEALVEMLDSPEDVVRERASKCLAFAVAADADAGEANVLVYGLADSSRSVVGASWPRRHSAAMFLEFVLAQNPSWVAGVAPQLRDALVLLGADEHVAVRASALQAVAVLVKQELAAPGAFVTVLVDGIKHNNKDVSKAAVKIAKRLAKRDPSAMRAHVGALVPALFLTVKSNNIAVKNSSERALLYVLEVHSRPETLAAFVRSPEAGAEGKVIAEYARRVLTKLRADSGDESD
ncbi:hypothetical protein PybrP1_001423 [[Pythium] brassicae (nom. inval.)]|nr:hypothetical protein PybrP1_001423 [[Pythium] brassicae (nom. inval.)]